MTVSVSPRALSPDSSDSLPLSASARPRSARAETTRERIVQAAAEAFARCGYLGVNLNQVVQELGLTKGALYYFFPTKEHLAAEIVHRHFAAFETLAAETLPHHENLLDALYEMGYEVADRFTNNTITRAGTRLSTERNLIKTELPEPFVGWIDRLAQLIDAGKVRGQIRQEIDSRATAQLMVSFFYGAQAVSDHFTGRSDLRDRLTDFLAVMDPVLRPPQRKGRK